MKKFLAIVLAVALLPIMSIFARDNSAVIYGELLEITTSSEEVVITGYDVTGKLVMSEYAKSGEDGKISVAYNESVARYKLFDIETNEIIELKVDNKTEDATPAPEVTPLPTIEPTPVPDKEYPSIFEKERDAAFTFAVVKKVSMVSDDGDDAYMVDVLIRGEEHSYIVPDGATIKVASDYFQSFEGADASALKEGDIAYFETTAKDRVKAIALIYRPLSYNPITSAEDFGENFEKLIAKNGRVYDSLSDMPGTVIPFGAKGNGRYQNAFGAVLDRDGEAFILGNRSGLYNKTTEISYEKDTIVYVVDMTDSGPKVSLGTVGDIVKSTIPKAAYDDFDNITHSDDYIYNIAFARVINYTATEVVIFKGYNE